MTSRELNWVLIFSFGKLQTLSILLFQEIFDFKTSNYFYLKPSLIKQNNPVIITDFSVLLPQDNTLFLNPNLGIIPALKLF
jgi:hypothetical protein